MKSVKGSDIPPTLMSTISIFPLGTQKNLSVTNRVVSSTSIGGGVLNISKDSVDSQFEFSSITVTSYVPKFNPPKGP